MKIFISLIFILTLASQHCCYGEVCDLYINKAILKKELGIRYESSKILSIKDLPKTQQESFFSNTTNNKCPGIAWVKLSDYSKELVLLLMKDNEILLIKASPLDSEDRSWRFKTLDKYSALPYIILQQEGSIYTDILGTTTKVINESIRVTIPGNFSYVYYQNPERKIIKIIENNQTQQNASVRK